MPSAFGMVMKRAFDVVVSSLALLLLLPLLVVVAALVRVNLGSPVLFRQQRPGRGGALFTILKFRTMKHADANLTHDADRLTPFGGMLRASSLDELPELWNVLRGDMSLVGPRPLLVEYLSVYDARQAKRHAVRPGITGWAQINGRNAIDWPTRLEMDVWYVENQSMWLDVTILLKTIGAVLGRRGISQDGVATMRRFDSGEAA